MTVSLANTFEGGTDTTTITTGNSGGTSGDAFSSVAGTPKFDSGTTKPGSSMAMKSSIGGSRSNQNVTWTFSNEASVNVYVRMYLYAPSGIAATFLGTNGLYFVVNTAGNIDCYDNSGTGTGGVGAFTGAGIVAAAWQRLELRCYRSATNNEDTFQWRIYNRPNSVIIDRTNTTTHTITSQSYHSDYTSGFIFGPNNSVLTGLNYDMYVDDIAVSTSGWIGPSGTPSDSLIGAVRDRPGRTAKDHWAYPEIYPDVGTYDEPARRLQRSQAHPTTEDEQRTAFADGEGASMV